MKSSFYKKTHATLSRARILKHFKVVAEKIALGKVDFSSEILKQPIILLTAARSSHASRKTAWMFKNPEKAGMDRKISFHGKSCLFSPSMKCLRILAQTQQLWTCLHRFKSINIQNVITKSIFNTTVMGACFSSGCDVWSTILISTSDYYIFTRFLIMK